MYRFSIVKKIYFCIMHPWNEVDIVFLGEFKEKGEKNERGCGALLHCAPDREYKNGENLPRSGQVKAGGRSKID